MWREILLGLLGYPGDGGIPAGGWRRRLTIGFYVVLCFTLLLTVGAVLVS